VDCQRDLRAVQVDYVHLRALEEENAQLKNLAHVLERKPYTSVGAQVIRREVYGDRALFTIDRGARDGVEMGQAVINDQGFFIGSISRLEKDMAQVQLLMDPQSRIAASLLGKETLVGVLEGRGMGAALLRYIPLTAKVEKGQILVTAGTDEKIPAALPLGAVALVQGKETDPFLEAIIELSFDVAQTQIVSVLIPTRSAP
jgi:rod shape-determining protein MreC